MLPKPSSARGAHRSQQPHDRVIANESLLATDLEKLATSKSLYGDHKARISSNVGNIHDKVRLKAFQVILNSLKNKNVLHLGCGMGLISLMAARALAKKVVAIDSSSIVESVAVVAKQNQLSNIVFLRGSIKDIATPTHPDFSQLPSEKFDVIICEWMGAFLTNESVLEDLVFARDHLLKEGGVICPNKSSLHVVGISDYNYYCDTVDYWDNVYGFNMHPMKKLVVEEASSCHIPRNCISTNSCLVHSISIEKYDELHDKSFSGDFVIHATKATTLHYLTFYIDASFTNPLDSGANFAIGFSPGGQNAWTEVSVLLSTPVPLNPRETVRGTLKVTAKGKYSVLDVRVVSEGSVCAVEATGSYNFQY